MSDNKGWIGVDLDGTLAFYDHWRGVDHIGAPIPAMVKRVKKWLAEGTEVRIVTARVYTPSDEELPEDTEERIAWAMERMRGINAIQDWCRKEPKSLHSDAPYDDEIVSKVEHGRW